jgi:hypothetical protein
MSNMSNRLSLVCTAAALGVSVSIVSSVSAQTAAPPDSLRGLLLGLSARSQAVTGLAVPEIDSQVAALAELTSLEVSTAPYGTSTGGFVFTFDSQIGTFTRAAQSYGPTFAQRSLTTGKGKVSAGFNWLHADYNSVAGFDLTNGDLVLGKNAKNLLPLSAPLRLDLSSNTIVGFATFGVTNDLDVGIVVPWVRVTMRADLGYVTPTNVDVTPGGHLLVVQETSASGVGDIAVVGRYHVWHQGEGGLAVALECRLPTGDTNSLRGAGVTRTTASVIWSRGGKISPHANVGYDFWSAAAPISATGDVFAKNQVIYAFGVEFEAHPRATVTVDVVGRRQLNGGQLGYQTVAVGPGSIDLLLPLPKAVDVVSLAPGIKWSVASNVLVTGNILTSLVNRGLKANVIPVVGLEWAF